MACTGELREMIAMLHTFCAGGVITLLGERGSGKGLMVKRMQEAGTLAGLRVTLGHETAGAMGPTEPEAAEAGEAGAAGAQSEEERDVMSRASLYAAWHVPMTTMLDALVSRRRGTDRTAAAAALPSPAAASAREEVGEGGWREVDSASLNRTLDRERAFEVTELLTARWGRMDPRLAYAPELNAVLGRLVVPLPWDYVPPGESQRGQVCADLAVALALEAASHESTLVILHLQTRASADASININSWKVRPPQITQRAPPPPTPATPGPVERCPDVLVCGVREPSAAHVAARTLRTCRAGCQRHRARRLAPRAARADAAAVHRLARDDALGGRRRGRGDCRPRACEPLGRVHRQAAPDCARPAR